MGGVLELLEREATPSFLDTLREVCGLPLAVGPGATVFGVLRQSAIERAQSSTAWLELCARYGFIGGGFDE